MVRVDKLIKKYDKWLWLVVLLVFAIFLFKQQSVESPSQLLTMNCFDSEQKQMSCGEGFTASTIGGVPGISFINFNLI